MQVYHRYMIQYSMILPYHVKVDHTLTFVNSKFASDPDIHLKIDNGGRLKSNLYDKHDDFTFPISQWFSRHISAAYAKATQTRLPCS
jgi:hypothetical protein